MKNRNKTLEALEKQKWPEPDVKSHVVMECHRLRKIPLSQFTTENLRLVIGQGFSLKHLMPIALERLRENPFTEGDMFPGDLLKAVLRTKRGFWKANPDLFEELRSIMDTVASQVELAQSELFPLWQSYFK